MAMQGTIDVYQGVEFTTCLLQVVLGGFCWNSRTLEHSNVINISSCTASLVMFQQSQSSDKECCSLKCFKEEGGKH